MKLVGAHNVINVMGAIAVAHELGIPLEELRIPVRRIQSVPHRMEMKNHGDVTIIDDAFNSNPIGSKAAVETLAMMDGIEHRPRYLKRQLKAIRAKIRRLNHENIGVSI